MKHKTTFFLTGAAGTYKSVHAQKLADALGCSRIEDPMSESKDIQPIPGTLYITNIYSVAFEAHAKIDGEHPSVLIDVSDKNAMDSLVNAFCKTKSNEIFQSASRLAKALCAAGISTPPGQPSFETEISRRCDDIAEALEKHGAHSPEYKEAVSWASKTLESALPLLLAASFAQFSFGSSR